MKRNREQIAGAGPGALVTLRCNSTVTSPLSTLQKGKGFPSNYGIGAIVYRTVIIQVFVFSLKSAYKSGLIFKILRSFLLCDFRYGSNFPV